MEGGGCVNGQQEDGAPFNSEEQDGSDASLPIRAGEQCYNHAWLMQILY